MTTSVTYYDQPLNIDYLLTPLRLSSGDLTGDIFSDTTLRTALVYAVMLLQPRWNNRYQVYSEDILLNPQPSDVPTGYMRINATGGTIDIPNTFTSGDVFRNIYLAFTQNAPPIIQSSDQIAFVLAAKLLLRRLQISSSATSFVSWSTDNVKFSALGTERSLSSLLADDNRELDLFFKQNLAQPIRLEFPVGYVPMYEIYT